MQHVPQKLSNDLPECMASQPRGPCDLHGCRQPKNSYSFIPSLPDRHHHYVCYEYQFQMLMLMCVTHVQEICNLNHNQGSR